MNLTQAYCIYHAKLWADTRWRYRQTTDFFDEIFGKYKDEIINNISLSPYPLLEALRYKK